MIDSSSTLTKLSSSVLKITVQDSAICHRLRGRSTSSFLSRRALPVWRVWKMHHAAAGRATHGENVDNIGIPSIVLTGRG